MESKLLIIENLLQNFDGIKALDKFSCSLPAGEILGIIGPNGAGKTTLFNVLTGFIPVESGKATFRGIDLLTLPSHRIAALGIARTFQKVRLIGRLTVLENVLLGFKNQPGEHLSNIFFRHQFSAKREAQNRKRAILMLEETGLKDHLKHLAEDLSYGQQKLLSLVCGLAAEADLLLLDEPIAGVAPVMVDQILPIIQDLPRQGKSVILIEHDLDVVQQVCNRVIFMDAGAIVSEGTPEEVRNDPKVIEAYID